MSKIEVSKVAVFANGQPVVTAILGYIFLRQGISPMFAAGAVTTIAGVLITQLRGKHIPGGVSPASSRHFHTGT